MSPSKKLSFDRFVLDPANASLMSEGTPVPVTPKVFELLGCLVSRAGQLVTKDQLLDAVWQHRHVSESVLKDHVSDLRQALGDRARAPRYIETVARRGYRFIAEVREVVETDTRRGDGVAATLAVSTSTTGERSLFVGRTAALQRLEEHWQRALANERQVVFLYGEAGIGKTALIDMFLTRTVTNGGGGLRARCVEHFGEGEGYLPLVEALTERCHATGGVPLIAALRQRAPTWLMQMPGLLGPADREALRSEVLGTTRERMLREFCEFLEALTREMPLVLILEDLHWSDYATLDVLSLLARRAYRARLLVLGSYRPSDAAHRTHPVARIRQELGMRGLCSELRLDVLSAADVTGYLNRRLGGSAVANEVADVIYARSDGHPLFLVNLVDYLVAERRMREDGGCLTWATIEAPVVSIPDSLKHLMQRQFESLEPEEAQYIEAASVAGGQFSAALVAAALNADVVKVEATCERLARREQWLKSAGIAEWPDGTIAGCYAFQHALYVEVVYQRLAPAQRVHYHRNISERLSTAYGENRGEVAAQLALHFEQARSYERAICCLQLAADRMARRWAFSEALGYLSRALQITERLPQPAQAATRAALLHQQATVRRSVGDVVRAAQDLNAMLAGVRIVGDRRREVQGLMDLSDVLDRRRCLECARQAVELSQALDDELIGAMARANYAGWSLLWGEWHDDHVRALEEGLATARRTTNPQVLNSRLALHALVESLRSNYGSARLLAAEGMTLAESLGDGYQFALCEFSLSWALSHLGCWSEAKLLLEKSVRLWSKNQNARVTCIRWLSLAFLSGEAQDFEGALRQCDEARAVYAERGDIDITVHCAERIVRGRAHLGLGEFGSASQCFAKVTQRIEEEGMLMDSYLFPLLHSGLAECWLAQKAYSRARQEAGLLCTVAERRPERTYLAHGHRLLAEIAMAEQAWDEATEQINKALDVVSVADVPLATWRVHVAAAALFDRQGSPCEAMSHRQRASEVIGSITQSLEPIDPLRISLCAHGIVR